MLASSSANPHCRKPKFTWVQRLQNVKSCKTFAHCFRDNYVTAWKVLNPTFCLDLEIFSLKTIERWQRCKKPCFKNWMSKILISFYVHEPLFIYVQITNARYHNHHFIMSITPSRYNWKWIHYKNILYILTLFWTDEKRTKFLNAWKSEDKCFWTLKFFKRMKVWWTRESLNMPIFERSKNACTKFERPVLFLNGLKMPPIGLVTQPWKSFVMIVLLCEAVVY